MKNIKNSLLVSLAILSFVPMALGVNSNNTQSKASMETVKQAITDKQKNVVIVDVRDETSYAKGHIAEAVNISHKKYNNFKNGQKEFPELTKNGINYVYCYNKECHLGERVANLFTALGYPSKDITGGYDSWAEAGYPIETAISK